MLGKLMKYEWKATWKLLLAANALTLVMTIIAWCMIKVVLDKRPGNGFQIIDFMGVMVLITYGLSIFAVSVGTVIFLIHRFYTSTYGDQGYLLHTLPVDTHHIILAKLFVSAAWVLIDIVSIYFSVLYMITWTSVSLIQEMVGGMEQTLEYLGAEKIGAFTVIMTLLAFLFSIFAKVLKVGACISLGQLSGNHKLMMSFAWYVGIYVVEQVIRGVYVAVQIAFRERIYSTTAYGSYFDNQWETTMIAGIISCVVYYLLTWYVMSRKLNLE